MKKSFVIMPLAFSLLSTALVLSSCNQKASEPVAMTQPEMVAHGKYLVSIAGCHDCHSPKMMTPHGPVLDTTKILSGSPAEMQLASIDTNVIAPGKWYLGSGDLTAWVGPWGVSYSANLTPDRETGTGSWTEEMFMKILRSGKFMGIESGRPIMPPMPWEAIGKMTDNDLKCIFAYLQSIKPIHNKVHDYVPPPAIASLNVSTAPIAENKTK